MIFIGIFINKYQVLFTDKSRLTYIVKCLMNSTMKSKWVRDQNGTMMKELIVSKITDFIFDKLMIYRECNRTNPEKMENVVNALKLESEIEKGIVGKDILSKLAPHFCLSANMIDALDTFDTSSEQSGTNSDDSEGSINNDPDDENNSSDNSTVKVPRKYPKKKCINSDSDSGSSSSDDSIPKTTKPCRR